MKNPHPISDTVLHRLIQEADAILDGNLREVGGRLFAMPNGSLYPAAWGWDTPQIAAGLYARKPDTALRLMEDFLAYQWPNGMVPHIVFPDLAKGEKFDAQAYFPPPHLWYMTDATIGDYAATPAEAFTAHPAYGFTDGKSTGIAQYPIWALNLRQMHEHAPIAPERLAPLVEKLDAFHRFFHAERDPLHLGIVAEFHPWMGCDNAPPYDKALHRIAAAVTPQELEAIHAQRVDIKKVEAMGGDASMRPTDADYAAFLKIAHGLARITAKSCRGEAVTIEDVPFAMYSPMLNGMLTRAEEDLAMLARACDRDDIAAAATTRAEKLRGGMMRHLWDGRSFQWRDGKSGEKETVDFLGSCLPLLDEKLPASVRDTLAADMQAKFADGFAHPLATTARDNPARVAGKAGFEPCYWRGPVWMNLNALLAPYSRNPAGLRDASLQLVAKAGFREYYNAENGKGLGANRFGWTAAQARNWAQEALRERHVRPEPSGHFTTRITGEPAHDRHQSPYRA